MTRNSSLENYKYVYITPTAGLTSGSGAYSGGYGPYGGYGFMQSKSVNPSDIIAGVMIKNGFTRLSEIDPELVDKTLIVNYGESGRRNVFLGYAIEVTLQFLSAETHEVLCTCTAEGMGETEVDDIRIAVNKALKEIFPSN